LRDLGPKFIPTSMYREDHRFHTPVVFFILDWRLLIFDWRAFWQLSINLKCLSTRIAYVTSLLPVMHGFKAKHVPALDGLRGIAILLVITHHQLIPFSLNGGFLGVDLFFVLSGFLITNLLLKEFDATKSISLTNFYARRALRLAPAFLIYLVAA